MPPSSDVEVSTAERPRSAESMLSAIWYSLPAASKLTHGSVVRGYAGLPEHSLNAAKLRVQDAPPSNERAATNARAPPSLQRSCWKLPTTLSWSVGLTATCGSTSVLSYTTPSSDCPAVQARNGLVPLTSTASSRSYGAAPTPPAAMADMTSAAAAAANDARTRMTSPLL